MKRMIAWMSVLFLTATAADAVSEPGGGLSSSQIMERSIAYHDPNGVWDRGEIRLDVRTTYSDEYAERVGSQEATAQLLLSPAHQAFRYVKVMKEDVIEYTLNGAEGSVLVNGSQDISEEDGERLRVGKPALYRDYFEYLYGMPMKLRDPGTNLDPRATTARFQDREVWGLRVTYDAEVGEDIWYFYFDKTTFALTGYRFFHDESKNDGEYIAFEDEIKDEATGIRLPKVRAWYFNADDKHLATDDIISMQVQAQ